MSVGDSLSSQTLTSFNGRLTAEGARPRAFTFVQLVFEAKWIAVGTVIATSANGVPPINLSVEQSIPTGLPRELRVSNASAQMEMPISFAENEHVVLFLAEVKRNEGVLLGTGDVAKWPRGGEDWLFSASHVRPLGEVMTVIELLLSLDTKKTYEERVQMLLTKVSAAGPLGEVATAQYAADSQRWENVQSSGEGGLPTVRWLVAASFLRRAEREDPAVDYAVLQLLTTAPASIAIPYLIKRLNDPDAAVRDTAFSSLQTVVLPYTQESLGFVSGASLEQRRTSQRRWEDWWDQHRSDRLREEVPKMLSELDSPHVLRRSAANISLRLLSGRDVGYHAEDPLEQRREATSRWQAWWKHSEGLEQR